VETTTAPEESFVAPDPTPPRSTRFALGILAAFLIVFLAGQAVRPLTDSTEARYAEIAREMLVSGDWLIPSLDQAPHLSKPPLTTWLMAGCMAILGPNEIAARLPGLLAFLGTIFLVARLAALLGRPEATRWAGFLYAFSLGPLLGAMIPSTDTVLTFFEVAAVVAYLSHRSGSSRARWWYFAALGAAFMTKGPPGLLVPAAVVIGDRVLRKASAPPSTLPPQTRLLSFLPGWLLFAVIGLGWYVVVAVLRPNTMDYWLRVEVVYRIFTKYHRRNQSALIYLPTLVGGVLPWWLLFVAMFRKGREHFRSWPEGAGRMLRAWFLLPLAVFIFSRSRLPAYVLPLFPALCLALAISNPRHWSETAGRWFGIRPVFLVAYAAGLAALSIASISLAERSSWKDEARELQVELFNQDAGLLVLTPGDASSLEFYLAPRTIDIVKAGPSPDPSARKTVPEVAAEWQTSARPHLVLARAGEAKLFGDLLGPRATLLGTKRHVSLWLVPL
jgi:4-amino-4-deoxy-L-arabinose transferase-like glycosyltransferase